MYSHFNPRDYPLILMLSETTTCLWHSLAHSVGKGECGGHCTDISDGHPKSGIQDHERGAVRQGAASEVQTLKDDS